MSVTFVAASDLHGNLNFSTPPCDFLLLAGDICPCRKGTPADNVEFQVGWLYQQFKPWLENQPARYIVMTWGNHDWAGLMGGWLVLPCHILVDEAVRLEGINFYGTPWQRRFFDWAFNLEESQLAGKWALIPEDTDVLITHGPPYGYGDNTRAGMLGSPSLTKRILEVRPRLHVYGHIHPGRGLYSPTDGVTLANVSLLDDNYEMVHKPMVFEMEFPKGEKGGGRF